MVGLSQSEQIRKFHPLVHDARRPKTKLSFEDIPILFQMAEEATHIIRYFVIERRLQLLSPNDESGIGQTDGLEGIEIWRRGEYSWGMHSIIMTPT
jgi:hypothetical protein